MRGLTRLVANSMTSGKQHVHHQVFQNGPFQHQAQSNFVSLFQIQPNFINPPHVGTSCSALLASVSSINHAIQHAIAYVLHLHLTTRVKTTVTSRVDLSPKCKFWTIFLVRPLSSLQLAGLQEYATTPSLNPNYAQEDVAKCSLVSTISYGEHFKMHVNNGSLKLNPPKFAMCIRSPCQLG